VGREDSTEQKLDNPVCRVTNNDYGTHL